MLVDVQVEAKMPELTPDNLQEVAQRVASILLDGVRQQFIEGGIPRWQPLKSGGQSYLFDTGSLLQSIESETGVDGGEVFARVKTTGALPYAAIHQFGGYAGRGGSAYIPPRPYMVMTDETKEAVLKEAVGLIVQFLNAKPAKGVKKSDEF